MLIPVFIWLISNVLQLELVTYLVSRQAWVLLYEMPRRHSSIIPWYLGLVLFRTPSRIDNNCKHLTSKTHVANLPLIRSFIQSVPDGIRVILPSPDHSRKFNGAILIFYVPQLCDA